MTTKRQTITPGVVLSSHDGSPGHLCITISDPDGGRFPRSQDLEPEEVDQLVLHALGMTKPGDLDPISEGDYEGAVAAVRVWQGTRAFRESTRRRKDERDQVMADAGFHVTYSQAPTPVRELVDKLIEARKAAQK